MGDLNSRQEQLDKSANTIKIENRRKKLMELMQQMFQNMMKDDRFANEDLQNSFDTDHQTYAAAKVLHPNCPLKLKQQVDLEVMRKGKMLTKNVFSE